jgi:hypothetical protein
VLKLHYVKVGVFELMKCKKERGVGNGKWKLGIGNRK